jgi:hypothetical protein
MCSCLLKHVLLPISFHHANFIQKLALLAPAIDLTSLPAPSPPAFIVPCLGRFIR